MRLDVSIKALLLIIVNVYFLSFLLTQGNSLLTLRRKLMLLVRWFTDYSERSNVFALLLFKNSWRADYSERLTDYSEYLAFTHYSEHLNYLVAYFY
ncbi:hypothetical protein [Candidatus Pantoea bituminis]|uniref:hypothetical protein n=1 Tax=Candidatus Pantoea bituminis TaxID=2831036 RepID=UPI001C0639BB|nr:hypothetical protein [Pantoea bituminis]